MSAIAVAAPKLITLNAPTYHDHKTLVWLGSIPAALKPTDILRYRHWDSVVTSLDAAESWIAAGVTPSFLVLMTGPLDDAFFTRLYTVARTISVVALSDSILSCHSTVYWEDNYNDLLRLDHLHESYPFLTATATTIGSSEEAVQAIATLYRYDRMVRSDSGELPSSVWLITQYYRPKGNDARAKEIHACLERNVACSSIDRILLLNERDESAAWTNLPGHTKIRQHVIGHRLRYSDVIRKVARDVPPGVIVLLANADVFVEDAGIASLWKINLADRMLALLRWDVTGTSTAAIRSAELFGPRADSQDAWIFLSDAIHARQWPDGAQAFDFMLGQPGCDNAFAGLMMRQRFVVTNPALTVMTYHYHVSNYRTYHKRDYVQGVGLYVNLVPTYVVDTRQEIVPKQAPIYLCNESVAFEIKSSSLSNEITYCTMLEKEGRYRWEPQVENFWFEPAIPVYSFTNPCTTSARAGVAVTSNGLVYDLSRIYTGNGATGGGDRYNYWKSTEVDRLTPMRTCAVMLVIPFADRSVFSEEDVYVLTYLSRCLRMRTDPSLHSLGIANATVWMPSTFSETTRALIPATEQLEVDMNSKEVSVCWVTDRAVGFLPGPSTTEISREDVTALRLAYSTVVSSKSHTETTTVVLVVCDPTVLTMDYARAYLESVFPVGTEVRYVDHRALDPMSYRGVSVCILATKRGASKVWMLPKGARVIEFQQELELDGESQHWMHVCDVKPWILFLAKGTVVDVQDQITAGVKKWWKRHGA